VFKLSHEGKILMTLGTKGSRVGDATHFNHPTDVAVAANGDVYVSDGYGNARVAKFDSTGKFLFDWGSKGTRRASSDRRIAAASRSDQTLRYAHVGDRHIHTSLVVERDCYAAIRTGPARFLAAQSNRKLCPLSRTSRRARFHIRPTRKHRRSPRLPQSVG